MSLPSNTIWLNHFNNDTKLPCPTEASPNQAKSKNTKFTETVLFVWSVNFCFLRAMFVQVTHANCRMSCIMMQPSAKHRAENSTSRSVQLQSEHLPAIHKLRFPADDAVGLRVPAESSEPPRQNPHVSRKQPLIGLHLLGHHSVGLVQPRGGSKWHDALQGSR